MSVEASRVYQIILLISIVYLAIIKPVSSACHSDPSQLWATTTPKRLDSPNYPQSYDPFSDCKWLIRAANNSESIKIEIRSLNIEHSTTCTYDKLVIYDGSTTSAEILATLCGKTMPVIVSSGSAILLHFTSDWGIQEHGFSLRYSAVFGEEPSNFLDKYQDIATIVGASIGGIVIACVFIYVIWLSCYTFLTKSTTRATNRCAPTPDLYHTSASGQFCDYPVGPPSYEFAVPTSPPPPYSEVDPNPQPRSFIRRFIDLSIIGGRPRRHSRMRPSRPLSTVTHRNSLFGSRNTSLFSNVRMTNGSQPSCLIVTESDTDPTTTSASSRSPTRRYSQSPTRNITRNSHNRQSQPSRGPRRSRPTSPRRASVHSSGRFSRTSHWRSNESPRRSTDSSRGTTERPPGATNSTQRTTTSPRRYTDYEQRTNESPRRVPEFQTRYASPRRATIHSPRHQSIPNPSISDANNYTPSSTSQVPQGALNQNSTTEVPIPLSYSSLNDTNEVPILQPLTNSSTTNQNGVRELSILSQSVPGQVVDGSNESVS